MQRLIQRLSRLPGIGKRSAERITFALSREAPEDVQELADAIADFRRSVRPCRICFNLSEADPCAICTDARRDASLLLVVEEPKDVMSFETTGMFRGQYHVLMGRLAALDGVGPGELTVGPLVERVKGSAIREVILGTSPTLEGDGTALHLAQLLHPLGVKVTRLARGLPTGYGIENASKAVLADAIDGRQSV